MNRPEMSSSPLQTQSLMTRLSLRPGRPSPLEEMHVVLTIASSFQQATQQADEKARALAALYLAISTAAATQSDRLAQLQGVVAAVVWSGTVVFVLAFLSGGYWLVQANRPRLTRTSAANRFSFPNVARVPRVGPQGSPDVAVMTDEVHQWSEVLAQIAVVKNLYVARAIAAVSVMFLISLLYLVTVAGPI